MSQSKAFKLYPIISCPNFEKLAKNFNSGNLGIDDFFREYCLSFDKEHKLKTFVLLNSKEDSIVGFFSSTVGFLIQSIKENDGSYQVNVPYINLAYFAIDEKFQSQGIGRAMMMEFFSMCMVTSLYTGVKIIYLESVDESVGFYKKTGYKLLDERKTPEAYQKYGNDTSNMEFPMLREISDLTSDGYIPYSNNVLPISVEKNN